MPELSRRSLFTGLGALIVAPAVVHATSLMPIRGTVMSVIDRRWLAFYDVTTDQILWRCDVAEHPLMRPLGWRLGVWNLTAKTVSALEREQASRIAAAELACRQGCRQKGVEGVLRQYHFEGVLRDHFSSDHQKFELAA